MRILITGARGFIGSHLGNKLSSMGETVTGIDDNSHVSDNKTSFDVETGNIFDIENVENYDAIIHLAASINVDESIERPVDYLKNNTLGTLSLLEVARITNPDIKFIFASSAEVYGTAQRELMDEDHPLDPLSPYAVSKLAAEQLCKVYAQVHGMNVTIVRNFNTFGEYQSGGRYGGVIAKFADAVRNKGSLVVYGSGEQSRDYMHISQAVSGYVLALQHRLPLVINFGSGTPIKIIDIANFMADKYGVKIVHDRPRPNEIMRLRADVSRATQYGYTVATDFWKHLDQYLDNTI